MICVVFVQVLTLIFRYDGVACDPGTHFVFTLPQTWNPVYGPSSGVWVTPYNSSTYVTVNVTTLTSAPRPLTRSFSIAPRDYLAVPLNNTTWILPQGTFVTDMTMEVRSSDPVTVTVVNEAGSNGDGYTLMPVERWGTEYYALGFSILPAYAHMTSSFITVSAVYDDTKVNVTLPTEALYTYVASPSVWPHAVLNGVMFYADDVITVTLNRLQTLQIQMRADLTGAHVVSNKPVSVQSGQNRTGLLSTNCLSHAAEVLPPVTHWGTEFVLVHFPEQTLGDLYRFVARDDWTTVRLGNTSSNTSIVLRIQSAGGYGEVQLPGNRFLLVQADKPVLVGHYVREQPSLKVKPRGDPALFAVTPTAHALDYYRFSIQTVVSDSRINSSWATYLLVVAARGDADSILLNGQVLSGTHNVTWNAVEGSMSYVVGHVQLFIPDDLPCTVGQTGGPVFNAYLFQCAVCECRALSLTHGSPLVSPVSASTCKASATHSPGDGIDNDCDERVDEEPCCLYSVPLDVDRDSLKNEDCAPVESARCCVNVFGSVYKCKEDQKMAFVSDLPDSRRRGALVVQAPEVTNKMACVMRCARSSGCLGTNFDPSRREGHSCELLYGPGNGVVSASGWGYQHSNVSSYFSVL